MIDDLKTTHSVLTEMAKEIPLELARKFWDVAETINARIDLLEREENAAIQAEINAELDERDTFIVWEMSRPQPDVDWTGEEEPY